MTISEPRIPIYSNVTGEPFKDAADIQALLPRQLVEPVQWEGTVRKLVAAGEDCLLVRGCGTQQLALVYGRGCCQVHANTLCLLAFL